jgi:regulator of cell morphogenesis and NO signaling
MREDHLAVGELLHRMRALAGDYQPPERACRTWRLALAELEDLEADVLRHVHLENHVLAPRFAPAA